jgi:SanA protein
VLTIVALVYFISVFGIKYSTKNLIYVNANEIPKHEVGIIFGAEINGNQPITYLQDRLDAGILL